VDVTVTYEVRYSERLPGSLLKMDWSSSIDDEMSTSTSSLLSIVSGSVGSTISNLVGSKVARKSSASALLRLLVHLDALALKTGAPMQFDVVTIVAVEVVTTYEVIVDVLASLKLTLVRPEKKNLCWPSSCFKGDRPYTFKSEH